MRFFESRYHPEGANRAERRARAREGQIKKPRASFDYEADAADNERDDAGQ